MDYIEVTLNKRVLKELGYEVKYKNYLFAFLFYLFGEDIELVYLKKDGKDVIIYDDGKEKHIVYQHCPHLGCKLLFNEIEKTWDCPCHGSRFDLDGKCISAPANKDITYK